MRSLSQLGGRLPLVAVVLAVAGVAAIGYSSTGESANESARELDRLPAQARFRSPCDRPVIVLQPESFVVTRGMVDVLRQRVEAADLPVVANLPLDSERSLLRVQPPGTSLRTRVRRTLRSLRDRVAVEDRHEVTRPAAVLADAEACRQ